MSAVTYLTPKNIPTSFTGTCLLEGAQSMTLNPPNQSLNTTTDIWIGKPLRFVARIVYLVVISIIVAPVGFLYHAGAAIYRGCQAIPEEENQQLFKDLSWEHLKASLQDLTSIVCIIFSTFSINPAQGTSFRFSSTKVYIDELEVTESYDYYVKAFVCVHQEKPDGQSSKDTQFDSLVTRIRNIQKPPQQ